MSDNLPTPLDGENLELLVFDNDDPYCPSAHQFVEAAKLRVAMERGEAGDPSEWAYPPSGNTKHSEKEIYLRVGYPKHVVEGGAVTFSRTSAFRRYLDIVRTYREVESMKENYNLKQLLKAVTLEGLHQIATQMYLSNIGLAEPVKTNVLFREMPRYMRLLEEMEGRLETAGVSVKIVEQHLNLIKDPDARRRAIEVVQGRLAEQAVDDTRMLEGRVGKSK